MCEPWLHETYPTHISLASQDRQTVWILGAEGTGEASVLAVGTHTGTAHWHPAGRRGEEQQSSNSGLGTHTRGGDVLSSYVYYYFFFSSNLARGRVRH